MPERNVNKMAANKILTVAIALVWLINGFFCKILNLVPRHQQIVSRILGEEYSVMATKVIGISETLMFIWIISRIKPRLCAIVQIFIVSLMNIIEFILVPDLLLFGKRNILLATVLVFVIFINEFILNKARNNKS
jgi:hypothetical protein